MAYARLFFPHLHRIITPIGRSTGVSTAEAEERRKRSEVWTTFVGRVERVVLLLASDKNRTPYQPLLSQHHVRMVFTYPLLSHYCGDSPFFFL